MASRIIKNEMETVEAFCRKSRYVRRSNLVGKRFIVQDVRKFHYQVARLDAHVKKWVSVGRTKYDTYAQAKAVLTGEPFDVINAFCQRTGWRVGSHLHGDMFVVSRPLRNGQRAWRAAKIDRTSVRVQPRPVPHVVRSPVLAHVQREGNPRPTLALDGAPAYPIMLYAQQV